jgi:hypothetical protein
MFKSCSPLALIRSSSKSPAGLITSLGRNPFCLNWIGNKVHFERGPFGDCGRIVESGAGVEVTCRQNFAAALMVATAMTRLKKINKTLFRLVVLITEFIVSFLPVQGGALELVLN